MLAIRESKKIDSLIIFPCNRIWLALYILLPARRLARERKAHMEKQNPSRQLRKLLASHYKLSGKEFQAKLAEAGISFPQASSAPTLYSDGRQMLLIAREAAGWRDGREIEELCAAARAEGYQQGLADGLAEAGPASLPAAEAAPQAFQREPQIAPLWSFKPERAAPEPRKPIMMIGFQAAPPAKRGKKAA